MIFFFFLIKRANQERSNHHIVFDFKVKWHLLILRGETKLRCASFFYHSDVMQQAMYINKHHIVHLDAFRTIGSNPFQSKDLLDYRTLYLPTQKFFIYIEFTIYHVQLWYYS